MDGHDPVHIATIVKRGNSDDRALISARPLHSLNEQIHDLKGDIEVAFETDRSGGELTSRAMV